jgi:penicillin-binding protein 2
MYEKNFRIKILTFVLILLTFLLLFRLYYIQIINSEIYSEKAVQQKIKSFNIGKKRGEIFDRNLIPFTDRSLHEYIYVIPEMIVDKDYVSKFLSKLTGNSINDIKKELCSKKDFLKYYYTGKYQGKLPVGVYMLSIPLRYDTDTLARHVIGHIGDKNMGLEKTFDKILTTGGNESIAVFKDGNNNDYLKGLGLKIRYSSDNIYGIKTTLDYHIQKAVENILDRNLINGAAVVIDVKNGDILAMASRPNYDQNKIQEYIGSKNEELINKALMAYPPGSIFKIIVASAALEKGKVDLKDEFIDTSSYEINGVVFHNFKNESNGIINIEKAFEVSSNTTFIKIGEATGGDNIIKVADKFGIAANNNLPLEEEYGMLPSIEDTYGAGIGNLSIGQGKVLITPLQAADMAATIADGGIRHVPNLLKSIVDENGKEVENLYKEKSYRVISKGTSEIIKKMMRDVVLNGTGKNAETQYGSAGKTGSAEVSKDLNIYHAWFTGFVPYETPRYAISIFVKNGDIGGVKAAPIFRQIADEIMKYYR